MTLLAGTALILFALFVLSGFVTLLAKERTHTIDGQETPFERLPDALLAAALAVGVVTVRDLGHLPG